METKGGDYQEESSCDLAPVFGLDQKRSRPGSGDPWGSYWPLHEYRNKIPTLSDIIIRTN